MDPLGNKSIGLLGNRGLGFRLRDCAHFPGLTTKKIEWKQPYDFGFRVGILPPIVEDQMDRRRDSYVESGGVKRFNLVCYLVVTTLVG